MTREDPLARVVFGLLVLASFAAFGVTQRLKHAPTVVQGIRLSARFAPGAGGGKGVERISFRIQRSDWVRVEVIDSQGDTVRTLAHRLAMKPYRRVYLYWNGHEAHGRHALAGSYRVRIVLLRQKRQIQTVPFDLLAGR